MHETDGRHPVAPLDGSDCGPLALPPVDACSGATLSTSVPGFPPCDPAMNWLVRPIEAFPC